MPRTTKFVLPVGKRGGITKRELYAALAMQGFASILGEAYPTNEARLHAIKQQAIAAVEFADALIEALGEQPSEEGDE